MIGDQEAGAANSLGLMSEQVASFVVCVVSDHEARRERRATAPTTRVQRLKQLLRLGARRRAHVEDLRGMELNTLVVTPIGPFRDLAPSNENVRHSLGAHRVVWLDVKEQRGDHGHGLLPADAARVVGLK